MYLGAGCCRRQAPTNTRSLFFAILNWTRRLDWVGILTLSIWITALLKRLPDYRLSSAGHSMVQNRNTRLFLRG
jgi:hypothetical protein